MSSISQDVYLQRSGAGVYAKVAWRLIPFLFFCYLCAYLDRINVSFAKLQMLQDLGMSDAVYGLGAGIFFVGYLMFEVPSNLILLKVGARRWIARIMVTWGVISAAMMFVSLPIVDHSSVPSLESMITRVRAAVAEPPSRIRTL